MTDLLAVGPHPDDVELAAGGTVFRSTAAGRRVVLCDLTQGERGTRGSAGERAREAAAAAAVLGVTRVSLGLPDGGVDGRAPEAVLRLVTLLRREKPRVVLALSGEDDHPDHVEGALLVRRAVYLAGLRHYPGRDETPHRVARLFWAMGRRPFVPSFVVDVSDVYDRKRAALAAYASQFTRAPGDPLTTPISDPDFLSRLEARDRHYGGLIGAAWGEPFQEAGPFPVRDVSLLFGEVPA